MQRSWWLSLLASVLLVNVGCRTTCERPRLFGRKNPAPTENGFVVPAAPTPSAGSPSLPQGPPVQPIAAYLPPGAVLNPPPGATIVQPGSQAPTFSNPPQNSQAPTFSNPPQNSQAPTFSNPPANPPQTRIETQWQSTEAREPAPKVDSTRDVPPRINLYAPEPMEKDAARDSVPLGPPQIETERKPANEPPPLKKPSVQANFPTIPQFSVVKEKVYAGLRPPLDGLDWLQANGIQTVIQIRPLSEDDSADRKQVEKRNIRYISYEVAPQTLTREKAADFIRMVREHERQGLFVYDQDGSLAGAMWYYYLRVGENYDDDASQLRARPLGMQLNPMGTQRDMWLALQRILSQK